MLAFLSAAVGLLPLAPETWIDFCRTRSGGGLPVAWLLLMKRPGHLSFAIQSVRCRKNK